MLLLNMKSVRNFEQIPSGFLWRFHGSNCSVYDFQNIVNSLFLRSYSYTNAVLFFYVLFIWAEVNSVCKRKMERGVNRIRITNALTAWCLPPSPTQCAVVRGWSQPGWQRSTVLSQSDSKMPDQRNIWDKTYSSFTFYISRWNLMHLLFHS